MTIKVHLKKSYITLTNINHKHKTHIKSKFNNYPTKKTMGKMLKHPLNFQAVVITPFVLKFWQIYSLNFKYFPNQYLCYSSVNKLTLKLM